MSLDQIHGPDDLKRLSILELQTLSKEIRSRIIEVMSINGGHLGSNLGSVEFTLALHYVFSSPTDRFIWDVSHQAYTHKLITGRKELFSTIRKYQGLSGFSHPGESIHDHLFAGHAGTAISSALGMAHARDLNKGQETLIPIIGDASLTCGLSLEALNNVKRSTKKFILVLNDNKMSISENVGAISQILSRLLSNPTSNKFLHDVDSLVSKIPSLGPSLSRKGHKIAESMKHLVSPAAFFEQYHLSYVGPTDGHDIESLIETFENLKNTPYPVIVHLLTKKGYGMDAAENNPALWHGAKPFSKETCKFLPATSEKPTFPKVFGKAVLKLAEEDEDLVVVTPAMSQGSCLDEMMKRFPERCIDVGIAEGHAVTFAAGIAWRDKSSSSPSKRKKVIASIYSTFLQRALDNLFHDVCIQEIPLIFALDRAGLAGADGITHNGIYDIGFLNTMPNMVICQPRSGRLLRELLNSSFSWERPTAIRYPNLPTTDDEILPLQERRLGEGEVLFLGETIALFALGHLANLGEDVRKALLEYGIRATLIDPIFIKPLDEKLLAKIALSHPCWVTIEEHSLSSGFGSIVNHFVQTFGFSHIQTLNIGIPDLFVHHGSHQELSLELGLTKESIVQKILLHFQLKAPTPVPL